MRVAACQLPDVRDDFARATELIRDFGKRAHGMGADLVCFPECFLQGYFTDIETAQRLAIDIESSRFDEWLEGVRDLQSMIVLGLIERSGRDFFNSAVVVQKGNLVALYRKNNLLDGEKSTFSAGREPSIFEVCGAPVGVAICHDLNSPAVVSQNAAAGAKLIACPCNNMMRRATAERFKDEHTTIRRAHAKKADLWILSSDVTGYRDGCVSYGPTSLIRPDGVVVDEVPLMATGMIVTDVE